MSEINFSINYVYFKHPKMLMFCLLCVCSDCFASVITQSTYISRFFGRTCFKSFGLYCNSNFSMVLLLCTIY